MPSPGKHWSTDQQLWVELFVLVNVAFLTLDIYLAHSVNQFRSRAEYIPLFFSAIAPLILLIGLTQRARHPWMWRSLGHLVGWAAILIGLTGVLFHLESHFFYERTIRSLTYSAPFAAPLAYTGLGFLLVLDRMVDADSLEWAQWVLFFTLGGFAGNFVFTLMDHAEDGFFNPFEWVPVFASGIAIGFLFAPLLMQVSRRFITVSAIILFFEAVVGVWGFILHAELNLNGPSVHWFDNFIYGASPMAPLLFPNLTLLGWIALYRLRVTQFDRPASILQAHHHP